MGDEHLFTESIEDILSVLNLATKQKQELS
jgi:hypothetical protein